MKPWKQLSTEVKFKNPWWEYRQDSVELPDGSKGEYHYVHTGGGVTVVPITQDGQVILNRQYRYLYRDTVIEFVQGAVNDGEAYEAAAARECAEETGMQAERLELVSELIAFNGVSDEVSKLYIATGLTPVDSKQDAEEFIETFTVSAQELDDMIERGEIIDCMTLSAWMRVRSKLAGL